MASMEQGLMPWLEDVVKHIIEKKSDGVAFVSQSDDGETFTAYFNVGPCRKMEFAGHIQIDAMREVVAMNGLSDIEYEEEEEEEPECEV